jgi:hypothetical protein
MRSIQSPGIGKHGFEAFLLVTVLLTGFPAAHAMGGGTEECEPSSGSDFGASGLVELQDKLW